MACRRLKTTACFLSRPMQRERERERERERCVIKLINSGRRLIQIVWFEFCAAFRGVRAQYRQEERSGWMVLSPVHPPFFRAVRLQVGAREELCCSTVPPSPPFPRGFPAHRKLPYYAKKKRKRFRAAMLHRKHDSREREEIQTPTHRVSFNHFS